MSICVISHSPPESYIFQNGSQNKEPKVGGKGKESDLTDASANTSANASADCWPTVGRQVAHFLNWNRPRCVSSASVACRWLVWALLNSCNAEHTYPKLNWNVFDTNLSLGYGTTKLTFDRHLVFFRVIRTQFPLGQVLLEPSSHFGKRVGWLSADCRPTRRWTVGRHVGGLLVFIYWLIYYWLIH